MQMRGRPHEAGGGLSAPPISTTARGGDEGREEIACGRVVIDQIFWMPLHTHDESTITRPVHGLDDAVRCPGHFPEASPQAIDGLMVKAVHLELGLAEDRS